MDDWTRFPYRTMAAKIWLIGEQAMVLHSRQPKRLLHTEVELCIGREMCRITIANLVNVWGAISEQEIGYRGLKVGVQFRVRTSVEWTVGDEKGKIVEGK